MKAFTLTVTTILCIGFFISNTCNAQTHRLLSKIEETTPGNNFWDKVTVMLPSNSYTLNDVSYKNNTLLILFDYSTTIEHKTTFFTLNLSDHDIDSRTISEQASFQVVGKPTGSKLNEMNWSLDGINSKISDPPINTFRCPVYCPF